MKYKMIALDLDGTLTNSEKIITEKTKAALMKAQEEGMCVVLASGRPDLGMDALADELMLDKFGGYVLSFNGAKIINWKTKEIVHALPVPEKSLKKIYEICGRYELPLLAHEKRQLITCHPEDKYVVLEAKINHMPIKKIEDYEGYVSFPIYKFIATGEGEELERVEPVIRDYLAPECDVYRSTQFFLEIVARGVDKADGLKLLAEMIGITMDEAIACGDGFNDIKMIKEAGLGVAMANAEQVVKDAADYITLSNDEDGIAHMLSDVYF